MAKGLMNRTDKDKGVIKSVGVGLREGELQQLEELGQKLGEYMSGEPVARNALIRIAVIRFLDATERGELSLHDLAAWYFDIPDKPQPRLKKDL
jgi:hypothetical protein